MATLTSRWCISFIGTLLLAALAWFFAPLLPGFADWPARLAVAVALLAVWAGANALLDVRRLCVARGCPRSVGRQARRAGLGTRAGG